VSQQLQALKATRLSTLIGTTKCTKSGCEARQKHAAVKCNEEPVAYVMRQGTGARASLPPALGECAIERYEATAISVCRRSPPFGYGVEEPPAFCPRTHAAMICQSGSSWDLNCLPPWWVSARPPTSGASGISSNRLCSGLPGVTSFETV